MNYTQSNLIGQGIAIGSNFYVVDNVSTFNDMIEVMDITEDSPLRSLTKATLGTQPLCNNPITNIIKCEDSLK